MKKKDMDGNRKNFEEILPKKPKKIHDDLPHDHSIVTEEAKLSKDTKGQFFVRFPKRIAQELHLESVDSIEFAVKIILPQGKPEQSELAVRLKRK